MARTKKPKPTSPKVTPVAKEPKMQKPMNRQKPARPHLPRKVKYCAMPDGGGGGGCGDGGLPCGCGSFGCAGGGRGVRGGALTTSPPRTQSMSWRSWVERKSGAGTTLPLSSSVVLSTALNARMSSQS